MLAARCAGVVRALVVRTARRAQPDLVRAVVRIVARCAAHDCLRSVVPMAGSSCRVVRCRCGTLLRIAIVSLAGSPNTPLQRTRVAPRDQADFRMWFSTICCTALDGAPLNGRPLAGAFSHLVIIVTLPL